jgi:hypothetical protein
MSESAGSHRWQREQLGVCHCEPPPLGREPMAAIRGGEMPLFEQGGVEHLCPTAEYIVRKRGPKPQGKAGAKLSITLSPELRDRVLAAAGGDGQVSEWIRPLLEAGCDAHEAKAAQRRARSDDADGADGADLRDEAGEPALEPAGGNRTYGVSHVEYGCVARFELK